MFAHSSDSVKFPERALGGDGAADQHHALDAGLDGVARAGDVGRVVKVLGAGHAFAEREHLGAGAADDAADLTAELAPQLAAFDAAFDAALHTCGLIGSLGLGLLLGLGFLRLLLGDLLGLDDLLGLLGLLFDLLLDLGGRAGGRRRRRRRRRWRREELHLGFLFEVLEGLGRQPHRKRQDPDVHSEGDGRAGAQSAPGQASALQNRIEHASVTLQQRLIH
jgi:hypothetical protein